MRIAKSLVMVLACLALIGLVVFLGQAIWLTGRSTGILEGAATAPGRNLTPAQSLPSAELQKEIDSAAHDALERDENLLDKLLLLVGVYTTILSFLALGTVLVSRQDAKEQLQKIDKLRSDGEADLNKLRSGAEADFKKLNEQVQREFPIISQLQRRVLSLILELEAKYPEGEDIAKKRPSTWRTELQQQDALIDELQILAVSVVALDEENLFKLYLALARLYLSRFRTGTQTDDDAARAYLYAERAKHSAPKNAEAYRVHAVTAMVRYQSADKNKRQTDEFAELLKSAKADLIECKSLDPYELGAYYNLAIVHDEEGNRPEAIRLLEEAIASLPKVPRHFQEKYLADLYVNLACYIADEFRATTDKFEQDRHSQHVGDVCAQARTYLLNSLNSSKALRLFRDAMRRELAENGDFRGLPPETRARLERLAEPEPIRETVRS